MEERMHELDEEHTRNLLKGERCGIFKDCPGSQEGQRVDIRGTEDAERLRSISQALHEKIIGERK